jgi:hypothetical protein
LEIKRENPPARRRQSSPAFALLVDALRYRA